MRTMRQFAEFVGKPGPVISFFGLRSHLFGTTNNQGSSLRSMIQQFEALPAPFDFTLDVKPQSGSAPLLVNTRYGTFVGVRINGLSVLDGFRVLQNGQVIRIANSQTGFSHRFHDAGKFVIEGAAQGVGRNGYARVVRTVTVDVKGQPQPEPPKPEPNLSSPSPGTETAPSP